jgi:hypothetical protein
VRKSISKSTQPHQITPNKSSAHQSDGNLALGFTPSPFQLKQDNIVLNADVNDFMKRSHVSVVDGISIVKRKKSVSFDGVTGEYI